MQHPRSQLQTASQYYKLDKTELILETLTSTASTSTFKKVMPEYLVLSSSKYGEIIRQGPHQVAEKSTMTCIGQMLLSKKQ